MYALALTANAKALYALAKNYPGTYMTSSTQAMQSLSTLYPSTGYHDELGWAALWLYRATNDSSFLTDATSIFAAVQGDANSGSGFQVSIGNGTCMQSSEQLCWRPCYQKQHTHTSWSCSWRDQGHLFRTSLHEESDCSQKQATALAG